VTDGYVSVVTGPSADDDPLTLAFVRDHHLRCANGTAEDDYVESLMAASRQAFEDFTGRALLPQTLTLSLERFPRGACAIVLPRPPLIEVTSITYVDDDGVTQTLDTSSYIVSRPTGPRARYGWITPAYNETWPSTRVQPGAVTVTYRAGYPSTGSPATVDVPEPITHGRLLVIGELYKQRSESVHAYNQNPALIRARSLWQPYRVF